MKRSLFLFLICARAYGALGVMAIDVRPTVGSATNGGAWVVGASGTDMSIFNNKNATACTSCQSATVNISTVDGVTAGTTSVVSATGNYSAALIGDVVYIAGGTGSVTAARYQVISVTNATTFVVDRSTGLTAGTGVTINIGGALDSPITAMLFNTAGSEIHVKSSGTLSLAVHLTFNNNLQPAFNAPANQLIGYNTVHFDCDNFITAPCAARPTIQASAGSFVIFDGNATGAAGWQIRNFILDCNSQTSCTGLFTATYWSVSNVKVMNFTAFGIEAGGGYFATWLYNEVTGGIAGCTTGLEVTGGTNAALYNWVHDTACLGMTGSDDGKIIGNVVSNITGATSDCITLVGKNGIVIANTVYNCGRDGIVLGEPGVGNLGLNNIIVGAVRYGLAGPSSLGNPAQPGYDGNWFYNNGTNRRALDDTGATNAINGQHYTNFHDVIGTGDPFTNAAANNFILSGTAAGLSARGTAIPGTIPGLTGLGYSSFGALQPQGASGAANSAFVQ